ncbi:MAG: Lpg1974 family pore-forming outer membrane protein [Bauldia sp.]
MKISVQGRLLPTMAASATALGGLGVASAEAADYARAVVSPPPVYPTSQYVFSVEGGPIRAGFANDKLGASPSLSGGGGDDARWDAGLYGAVAVTSAIDATWDWRLSGAWNYFRDNKTDLSIVNDNGVDPVRTIDFNLLSRFGFQTVDFDIGRKMMLGQAQVRLFGGLRGLHVNERQTFSITEAGGDPTDKFGTVDKVGRSSLWGLGVRGGVDAYVPLSANWGLVGSASAAGIWGARSSRIAYNIDTTDPDPPNPPDVTLASATFTQHSSDFIANYGASVGVSYMPWANTSVVGGYRWDAWDNLRYGDEGAHRLFEGPFFRVEVRR